MSSIIKPEDFDNNSVGLNNNDKKYHWHTVSMLFTFDLIE